MMLSAERKVVDSGLLGNRRRGERVVAGDHHRADTDRAKLVEALLDPLLHHVLQLDDAERLCAVGHHERRGARRGDPLHDLVQLGGHCAAVLGDPAPDRLGGPARHREHVALDHPVQPGDPDGAEQRADGGRDQADQQRDQRDHRHRGVRPVREGLEHDHDRQEDDRERREQDRERDLVRGLLPVGALDE
jgi:hypothetical protein